jgi:pimeloyl-ACP methyl ester carboxylesterase
MANPTPSLPAAARHGIAPVNGVRIWYAEFGHGEPVILLHGGLANANYWGNQVQALQGRFQLIVMDGRGHGRSTRNDTPYSYDLMASDVIGLMDFLNIRKAAIVGWSDGAIIGLDTAMKHPERLTKSFAFGANSAPSGVADIPTMRSSTGSSPALKLEYERLSPAPNEYKSFLTQIEKMWRSQPT